ncbi:hypothetical protein ILP92_10970 [Maribius pontilimi]|uniref:Peptidase inhibitor I78 family protein n=1 Tax=Palleronia pontilimi TaxID=1964209 RepID=A0A934IA47_9RHOB|nr:I78 family peptidase inhibitor [Palleronia pontilimi]MBJ3763268.1 hypothetical protein [Palleronia pontilimi]
MRTALILPFLALAACQTSPADAPSASPVVAPAACGADRYQSFVGGPVAAAQQAAGQSITRVYAQGDPVTMDLIPERINFVTDGNGTVVQIACG